MVYARGLITSLLMFIVVCMMVFSFHGYTLTDQSVLDAEDRLVLLIILVTLVALIVHGICCYQVA